MNKEELALALRGRTPEQQTVIKYFEGTGGGCFNFEKQISDDEYHSLVMSKVKSLNLRKRAMDKHSLDESQINEIEPLHLENWYFSSDNDKTRTRAKKGVDGYYRSSAYQTTIIFFGAAQVYIYQYTLNMDEDSKKEVTEDYFYKDITNFSTTSESYEKKIWYSGGCGGGAGEYRNETMESNLFVITVPGDKFRCSMVETDDIERRIKGMKEKLREKKGS